MEFLVRIDGQLPPDWEPTRRREVAEAESARGRELIASGTLSRIWRIPGTTSNVGIWTAPDAGVLHDALSSLPAFEWVTIEVTALAPHPLSS